MNSFLYDFVLVLLLFMVLSSLLLYVLPGAAFRVAKFGAYGWLLGQKRFHEVEAEKKGKDNKNGS